MDKLDEIRARCEAATPGPWKVISDSVPVRSGAVVSAMYGDGPKINICSGIPLGTHDAAFIAHAREDIPYLLDALASTVKLISAMRNNKKAALWLRKYGNQEAID